MKFLMDFIMPPLKHGKVAAIAPGDQNDNSDPYVVNVNLATSNDNRSKYTCTTYAPKVLKGLNSLRRDSRFCDVEIVAGGVTFPAHRAVLAASSPYFHAMFTGGLCEGQQAQRRVELHQLGAQVMEQLLEFIYTGEVRIDQANVQELMVAADMLELAEV